MNILLFLIKKHFLITWKDKRGAVVTHGSNLPDSAQKTDFYSIIDNATVTSIVSADISASAGIMDSQLNTISTAGKVNTSALTGQIANANLAQIVNPALVSGAALTLLPNIPSGAGIIPSANVPFACSTRNIVTGSRSVGGIYQNTTGKTMFISVTENGSGNSQVYSDSSSSPSTQIGAFYNPGGGNSDAMISFLVLPNHYYQFTSAGGNTISFWVEWS